MERQTTYTDPTRNRQTRSFDSSSTTTQSTGSHQSWIVSFWESIQSFFSSILEKCCGFCCLRERSVAETTPTQHLATQEISDDTEIHAMPDREQSILYPEYENNWEMDPARPVYRENTEDEVDYGEIPLTPTRSLEVMNSSYDPIGAENQDTHFYWTPDDAPELNEFGSMLRSSLIETEHIDNNQVNDLIYTMITYVDTSPEVRLLIMLLSRQPANIQQAAEQIPIEDQSNTTRQLIAELQSNQYASNRVIRNLAYDRLSVIATQTIDDLSPIPSTTNDLTRPSLQETEAYSDNTQSTISHSAQSATITPDTPESADDSSNETTRTIPHSNESGETDENIHSMASEPQEPDDSDAISDELVQSLVPGINLQRNIDDISRLLNRQCTNADIALTDAQRNNLISLYDNIQRSIADNRQDRAERLARALRLELLSITNQNTDFVETLCRRLIQCTSMDYRQLNVSLRHEILDILIGQDTDEEPDTTTGGAPENNTTAGENTEEDTSSNQGATGNTQPEQTAQPSSLNSGSRDSLSYQGDNVNEAIDIALNRLGMHMDPFTRDDRILVDALMEARIIPERLIREMAGSAADMRIYAPRIADYMRRARAGNVDLPDS